MFDGIDREDQPKGWEGLGLPSTPLQLGSLCPSSFDPSLPHRNWIYDGSEKRGSS